MQQTTFNEVYDRHVRMVYNLCMNYLHNPQDAEEATQDVFMKVHEGLSKFRGEAAVRTWIYRVAINTSLDHIKARKRKKRSFLGRLGLVDDHVDRLSGSEFDHPGVALENKEATAKIFECIDRLPSQQRTALLLKATEGMGQMEIAEVMGVTVKSAEALLARGKQKLKQDLTKD
ncbi:MAG: RNA polymerase sigma factor [Flavobacteriales bacterium]|nr:RNA polymerase sigma factor [Flavobacteriales bacterium]MBK6943645.1 RNA polymerase sigma factor [Flavobacteriales bacterium]MBK7239857.1 RNA polymerase sigma factor [Flavobacteriales bacterium]MBK7296902.1 RNA polymerase sigma factor [Flavobacteriales bacterium]MBK9535822.1 RNA polymerase sigma factor [Flavobacteriales bacterium]